MLQSAMRRGSKALQAFSFPAWDDVFGAKLDPDEVVKAREIEIGYAEREARMGQNAQTCCQIRGMEDNNKLVDRREQGG